jgi:hypothetical protein
LAVEIQHADRTELAEGQQDLPRLAEGEIRCRRLGDHVHRVGVQRIGERVGRHAIEQMPVFRRRDGADQGDLLQLLAVGREDHEKIVEPWRGEPTEPFEGLVDELVRQHVDPPVGPDVEVVMGMRQIAPHHLGVAVELDQAVAVGGVAGALVDGEQVAVRVEHRLAEVDMRVGLGPHRGALVPDAAVRPAPRVQHLAVHADEKGGGRVAGGVEGDAVLGVTLLMQGNAPIGAASRVPEVGAVDVVVGRQLEVERLLRRPARSAAPERCRPRSARRPSPGR